MNKMIKIKKTLRIYNSKHLLPKMIKNNQLLPSRKSLRLKNYDYTNPGLYFVTICTQNRIKAFGNILNGQNILTSLGHEIKEAWEYLPKIHTNCKTHENILMPDHLHGIIEIQKSYNQRKLKSLSDIISSYKKFTTKIYSQFLNLNTNENLPNKLWQKGYYDHIIRDHKDYLQKSYYIISNPLRHEMKNK